MEIKKRLICANYHSLGIQPFILFHYSQLTKLTNLYKIVNLYFISGYKNYKIIVLLETNYKL